MFVFFMFQDTATKSDKNWLQIKLIIRKEK